MILVLCVRAKQAAQEKYDDLKDIDSRDEEDKGTAASVPPPASPVSAGPAEVVMLVDPSSTVGDSMKMDYDTYMLNRRPGSTAAGSDASAFNSRYGLEVNILKNNMLTTK